MHPSSLSGHRSGAKHVLSEAARHGARRPLDGLPRGPVRTRPLGGWGPWHGQLVILGWMDGLGVLFVSSDGCYMIGVKDRVHVEPFLECRDGEERLEGHQARVSALENGWHAEGTCLPVLQCA